MILNIMVAALRTHLLSFTIFEGAAIIKVSAGKFNHISLAGTSLPQGAHTFKFRLKIPEGYVGISGFMH